MLLLKKNKLYFQQSHCTQCGVCISVCPKGALQFVQGKELYDVHIDHEKCIKCGLCVKHCAAHLLPSKPSLEEAFKNIEVCTSYSKDNDLRFYASSGGFCRSIIIETLERKVIDAVYTLIMPKDDEKEVQGKWLCTVPLNQDIPRSVYRVAPWGSNIVNIPQKVNNVLIIGLPCQLRSAVSILNSKNPKLNIYTIAIYCNKNKKLGFTKYIKTKCACKDIPNKNVIYRGDGWHLYFRCITDDQKVYSLKHSAYFAHCWNVPACKYCFDNIYLEGDFAVGDPWKLCSQSEEKLGKNILFIISSKGKELVSKLSSIVCEKVENANAAECSELNFKKNKFFNMHHFNLKYYYNRLKGCIGEFYLMHFK